MSDRSRVRRIQTSPNVRRLISLLVALLIAFPLASVLAPPDPFTQLLYVGILLVLAFPVATQLQDWV